MGLYSMFSLGTYSLRSLATLAYVFMTAGLYVRGDCTWQEFIHPVCVGILGNGWLAASVAWMNSKKK